MALTGILLAGCGAAGQVDDYATNEGRTHERRGQGAGKMSYNVVTQEGIRTFENIDDAGDYAQAMSLRTGEPTTM